MEDLRARATKARQIVSRLASTSRFAGSDAETGARGYCRSLLEERGFSAEEQQFEYSQMPGRWGPSVAAILAAIIVWLAAHLATKHHAPVLGLAEVAAGLPLLGIAGFWLARFGVLSLRAGRSSATNLVATRSGAESSPLVWIVAHLDSKSQTIPMLVRIGSAVGFVVLSAGVAACVLVLATLAMPIHANWIDVGLLGRIATILSYIAVAAAIPIVLCFVGDRSPGALDNATGVASVILALDKLKERDDFGVLITSAEELGLAGARAFVATHGATGIAINCDTIDDAGNFICMASGAGNRRLDEAIDRAASRLQAETVAVESFARRGTRGRRMLRLRGMIPGILADNVAFTDAGWESFTLSRGNICTLGLVHTSRDVPDRVKGTGIAKAADFIAAIVQELG
ncbi:MAG: M28 family peptidase [Gemmatimonadaceae bacterium]